MALKELRCKGNYCDICKEINVAINCLGDGAIKDLMSKKYSHEDGFPNELVNHISNYAGSQFKDMPFEVKMYLAVKIIDRLNNYSISQKAGIENKIKLS